jgi:hypothetical protein
MKRITIVTALAFAALLSPFGRKAFSKAMVVLTGTVVGTKSS